MQRLSSLAISFAILLGTTGIVFGELGDAPELILLGLVFVTGAVAFGVRAVRRGSAS